MSTEALEAGFRLGDWLIRPRLSRISRDTSTLHLQPRAIELLVFLAAHAREVVSKDELVAAVWRDRFISDSTLTRVIADLRRALGDEARVPRYIETIPKKGYRLIAEVEPERHEPRRQGSRIVVLPFQNMGPESDDFFAAGLTEEITTRLAVVSRLGVISRQSSLRVAGGHTGPEIAEMLGVDYILEGSVRWGPNAGGERRVRVTPQLIRVPEDVHVWASVYDGSISDTLEIQIRIAEEVLRQLDIVLAEPERSLLADRRTTHQEAYRSYLRGLAQLRSADFWSAESMRRMVAAFARSVELDPGFASGHAALAAAHAAHFWIGLDRSPDRLARAKAAIDRAVEVDPESPMVRLALGHYLAARGETDRALATLRAASERLPNESELFRVLGQIYRAEGRFDLAVRETEQALELDPRDVRLITSLGFTRCLRREYAEARRLYERALDLEPDQISTYVVKTVNHWLVGDLPGARQTLEAMPTIDNPSALAVWWQQEVMEGDLESALARLEASPFEVTEDYLHLTPKALLEATTYRLLGRDRPAGTLRASQRLLERRLSRDPSDARAHAALAHTLAERGDGEEAIRLGRRAVELLPIEADAVGGVVQLENLAALYLLVGDTENARELVERLLARPSLVSRPLLRADPRWRPLCRDSGPSGRGNR